MQLNIFIPTLAQDAPEAPNPLFQFMPLILIGVMFYFLLIRPQQKQRKEHQQLVSSLKSGDKVVTNAGIHGLIANVKEHTIMLKIADNVKIELDKASITRRTTATDEE